MARQPTTRLHVSGYRFLVRRMEHALLLGDLRMLHDPMRAQSLSFVGGCVVAVVVIAVCGILAFLRPTAGLGDAPIVMARDSGALYVHTGDTLHPVMNLASARLAVGSTATPRVVNAADIANAKRGPLIGIPGAPAAIAEPLSKAESAWMVCDDEATTVAAGTTDQPEQHGRQPNLLVTPRSGSASATYLLYDGKRAKVDLRDPGVVWALRLDGVEPRPVSRLLLDAIPEAPPIVAPYIPGAGQKSAVPGLRVGTVVRMTGVDSADYFVLLVDGVQRIGEVAANLIRIVVSHSDQIVSVSPDTFRGIPVVESLPVSTYPGRAGMTSGADDSGPVCAQWLPDGPRTLLSMGHQLPQGWSPIELVQHDGVGPAVDSFAMPPGRSAYVRSTSLVGDGSGAGPLYLVTDSGVLFGLPDEGTAKLLGVQRDPVPAPWPILSLLPRGPVLSRSSALVARDTVAPAP